jgi:hypothetical protein
MLGAGAIKQFPGLCAGKTGRGLETAWLKHSQEELTHRAGVPMRLSRNGHHRGIEITRAASEISAAMPLASLNYNGENHSQQPLSIKPILCSKSLVQ